MNKSAIALSAVAAFGIAAGSAIGQVQQDDFVGYYDGSDWDITLDPPGTDATATFTSDTLEIIGVDDGTSNAYIFVTIETGGFGVWEFDWFYDSTDTGTWDSAGYILNGVEHNLAYNQDGPIGGSESIAVDVGDEIGFYVFSVDGAFGPGELTITNHSAPIPAPGALALLGLAALVGARRRRS